MSIIFEIRASDGTLHTGAIMGSGGFLGGGAAHMGRDREREVASKELQRIIDFVNRNDRLPPGIVQKLGGLCVLHPVECLTADYDARHLVQYIALKGASFRVMN